MSILKTKDTKLRYKCEWCDAQGVTADGHVRVYHTNLCPRWQWLQQNCPAFVRMINKERQAVK